MQASEHKIDLTLTLHLSKKVMDILSDRATSSGLELADYVSHELERLASEPLSLEEISGPIYQRFLESGMTDDELSERLEAEKHAARASQRAQRAS
jgi:hypothetical protein